MTYLEIPISGPATVDHSLMWRARFEVWLLCTDQTDGLGTRIADEVMPCPR